MRRYKQTPEEEGLIVDLATHLPDSDVNHLLLPGARTLTSLLSIVRTNVTVYERDSVLTRSHQSIMSYPQDLWFLAWLEPFTPQTCFVSCYIRPDKRHTKTAMAHFLTFLAIAFDHMNQTTIMGLTRPDLIDLHKRFGYTHSGTVPLDDDPRDVVYLHKTKYHQLRATDPLWQYAYAVPYPESDAASQGAPPWAEEKATPNSPTQPSTSQTNSQPSPNSSSKTPDPPEISYCEISSLPSPPAASAPTTKLQKALDQELEAAMEWADNPKP
jgi:hypothetical protein